MAFPSLATEASSNWQARALRRSLDQVRGRSLDRMTLMVAAARDLANETGGAAFTVIQVAQRAGFSLKVFYRYFASKDELLLALIEEDSRMGADLLVEQLVGISDPVERLRSYVEGLFGLLTHPGAVGYAGVLVREYRRLSESNPDELRVALAPIAGLLVDQLAAAVEAGLARVDDAPRAAETVFVVLLNGINDVTAGRAEPKELATWLWQFCWSGLGGTPDVDHVDNQEGEKS